MKRIHMCCGKRDFGSGWLNIDGADLPHIHQHDVTKLDMQSDTVDIIYCSHGLEYFDRTEAINVLTEWYRVLKPKGILRLAVPDFSAICELYSSGKYSLESFLGPLYGKIDLNGTFVYHKTAYDFDSLFTLLTASGFSDIQCYDWRKTEHAIYDDHSQAYLPHMEKRTGTLISLNVECNK